MNFIPRKEDCIHSPVCFLEKDEYCPLGCGLYFNLDDFVKGGKMIAIIVKVPESAEFHDECEYMNLMRYTKDSQEQHELAASQIALFFRTANVRFPADRQVPFQVEVVVFTLEEEIDYGTIVQMLLWSDSAIRAGLEPARNIKEMRELLKLHDKFISLRNKLADKAAEIKHTITMLLSEKHKELFL